MTINLDPTFSVLFKLLQYRTVFDSIFCDELAQCIFDEIPRLLYFWHCFPPRYNHVSYWKSQHFHVRQFRVQTFGTESEARE